MSLPVTEDTPPDMLAGSMDLNVELPNGKNVKMSIQRSTPMMDLLVQVTTAHRLSPGNYSIQAMGDRGVLPYKPSTPIGTLDAFTIKIVDKKLNSHKKAPQVPQSFLNTFRLQVNLPRSQLFVVRVTPEVTLGEILTHVCTEKNLDINKYELRIPGNLDEVLELDKTLGNYKIQELSLVNKSNRPAGVLVSSADILHVKSSKHRQNSVCDSSLSSGSLGSRSTSPVPVNPPRVPPQPPIRKKRRPAPKPPQLAEIETKDEIKPRPVLISHSRESSDSSGYHEASVLSESPTHGAPLERRESSSPPDTLPRHGNLPPSQSYTNLTMIQPAPRNRLASSVSTASLNSTGASRKKRAAPPPPSTFNYQNADEKMKSSTLPTSRAEERIATNFPFPGVENGEKTPDVETQIVEESNTKVENLENVETESKLETETKVDVGTVDEANPALVDITQSGVVVSEKPVPKPRALLKKNAEEAVKERKVSISRSQTDSVLLSVEDGSPSRDGKSGGCAGREDPFQTDSLKNVWSAPKIGCDDEDGGFATSGSLKRWPNADALACGMSEDETNGTKPAWVVGDSEASGDVTPVDDGDQDFPSWQYQLPPPPTGFQDVHSPIGTELGTVTLVPEMYKEETDSCGKEADEAESISEAKPKDCPAPEEEEPKKQDGGRLSEKKSTVMSEVTNVLPKEKSSSVTNLYANDGMNNRKVSGLSYSKSFTNELPVKNMRMSAYETYGAENNRDDKYEQSIKYKNYKNLEKSMSMECIQTRERDESQDRTGEETFRKPVAAAPVQKKLKVAKRSSSTSGQNFAAQRKSDSDLDHDADAENIAVLRQHFLDFLKEKKLTDDLNMKSLNVIRHILPQINGQAGNEAKGPEEDKEIEEEDHMNSTVGGEGMVKVMGFRKNMSPLSQRDVRESVSIVKNGDTAVELRRQSEHNPRTEAKKTDQSPRRFSYHAPPAINFGTWGERPKTQVFIKDEDYVTEPKVTKKLSAKPVEEPPKPVVSKKPPIFQFKKLGVKSHYEMFSALPKKKEVTPLSLIQMEEEEKRRKKKMEEEAAAAAAAAAKAKEPSRVPVICGVELKKEFKEQQQQQGNKSISVTEVTIKPEVARPSHSVSIYINGNQRNDPAAGPKPNLAAKPNGFALSNMAQPKRTNLMPVVKGFRIADEHKFQSHVNINKICNVNGTSSNNVNNISNNIGADSRVESSAIKNQKLRHVTEVNLPPPPPPLSVIGLANLKPVSARQIKPKTESANPRVQLMEEIRNFRGFNSHRFKTAQ